MAQKYNKFALGIVVLALSLMVTLPCCAPYASGDDSFFDHTICRGVAR